jgi:hypothetical protein
MIFGFNYFLNVRFAVKISITNYSFSLTLELQCFLYILEPEGITGLRLGFVYSCLYL